MTIHNFKNTVNLGDCYHILKMLPDNSIDLIITSPPYAERRKTTYGGIKEELYVAWFKPIAQEIKRVMKPSGSFFLNIKTHTAKGERSLYVLDLVIMLKGSLVFGLLMNFAGQKMPILASIKGVLKMALS